MIDSKEELFKIAEEIRRCTDCNLCKKRTLTVPGEGKAGKVMIIGEGPGAEEDRLGRPFVGRAGKLLDKLLRIGGLSREETFITNCVKCRPPGNRNPNSEELKACRKWLDKQIKSIEPSLIVVLGRIALKNLLGKEKIKDFHGKVIEENKRKYFITYHPSAGLRFKWIKEVMEKDFMKLRGIIKNM